MRSRTDLLALLLIFAALPGCSRQTSPSTGLLASSGGPAGTGGSTGKPGGGNPGGGSASSSPIAIVGGTGNVLDLNVNGDGTYCGTGQVGYVNQECVTITICVPGTTTCQSIPNILLDTGSTGLRLFRSVVTVPLVPSTLAECYAYLGGDADWGPIAPATIYLAGEPGATVPIQLIDPSYGTPGGMCVPSQTTLDSSPADTGYNGIMGVNFDIQDCGTACSATDTTQQTNPTYFTCSGATCTAHPTPLADQVINPVSALPVDNNGLVVSLPDIPNGTAPFVQGSVILGIGTKPNNQPAAGAGTYPAPTALGGMIVAEFPAYGSGLILSFLDTGSSAYLFPTPTNPVIPMCATDDSAYCATSPTTLPVSNIEISSVVSNTVNGTPVATSIEVGDTGAILSGTESASKLVAFSSSAHVQAGSTAYFDFGLPFFFGKQVYVGITGRSSSLGTGPYWAY